MGQKKGLGPRLYPFARCTGKETVLWLRDIKQLICTALAQTTSTENQINVSFFSFIPLMHSFYILFLRKSANRQTRKRDPDCRMKGALENFTLSFAPFCWISDNLCGASVHALNLVACSELIDVGEKLRNKYPVASVSLPDRDQR